MATLANLRSDIQVRLRDQGARQLTSAQLLVMINDVLREFVNYTEDILQENAYAVTAYQFDYAAPTDIKKLVRAYWGPSRIPIECVSQEEFEAYGGFMMNSIGVPRYILLEGLNAAWRFRLYPTPSASSISTTLNDSGGISASDTSVILTSVSGLRSPAGWMLCENEKLLYQSLTSSTNTLGLLRRGMGGTTAASHADTTAITQLDLHVLYTKLPTALSADTDSPEIHADYHDALVYGVLAMALKTDGRNAEAAVEEAKFQQEIRRAKRNSKRRQNSSISYLLPSYY